MASTSKSETPPERTNNPEPDSSKGLTVEDRGSFVDAEKTLFVWKAASRPFQRRSREYWVTVISIASLLAFILFLAEGAMPVILIASLIFLYYILSTVSPEEIEYAITNRGIKIADVTTTWEGLVQFWFTKRMGNEMLVVETTTFPFRMEMVVQQKDFLKIKQNLVNHIPEGKKTSTYIDKTVDWVAKKLPNN